MKTELFKEENLIKSGSANLQKGIETVGGKIYLTNKRLVFESHNFNVQSGKTEIKLIDINSLEFSWTKLFGLIPLIPNSLSVLTKDNKNLNFALSNRTMWKEEIEKAKNSSNN